MVRDRECLDSILENPKDLSLDFLLNTYILLYNVNDMEGGSYMRKIGIVLLTGIVAALAQTPVFLTGTQVYAGSSPIDVGYYASPFYYDWDGDNIKDLVTGQFSSGNVRFYKNIGTNTNPQFGAAYSFLYADGSPISVYAS